LAPRDGDNVIGNGSGGELLASASDDRTVRLWDCKSKVCVYAYTDFGGVARSLAFHAGGVLLAAASSPITSSSVTSTRGNSGDSTIRVWDTRMHRVVQHYTISSSNNTCRNSKNTCLASQGRWILAANSTNVELYDLENACSVYTLAESRSKATTASISQCGSLFSVGLTNGEVTTWFSNLNTKSNVGSNSVPSYLLDTDQNIDGTRTECENPKTEIEKRTMRQKTDENRVLEHTSSKESALSTALESIVSQLDRITSTMNIIENRLALCEDRVMAMTVKTEKTPIPKRSTKTLGYATPLQF
jgi:centriolar protein POC1